MNEGPYFGDLRNNGERVDDPCLIEDCVHWPLQQSMKWTFGSLLSCVHVSNDVVVDGESKSPI